jgi:hypothetical protein
MLIISHRGNLDGPNPEIENKPSHIEDCIGWGYDVEIDLRKVGSKLYLGHDEPQYEIDWNWLLERRKNLWVHCKDADAFDAALKTRVLNCFWHNTDDYTLTSYNIVWAYPGKRPSGAMCIAVLPETIWNKEEVEKMEFYGVCTDYVKKYE